MDSLKSYSIFHVLARMFKFSHWRRDRRIYFLFFSTKCNLFNQNFLSVSININEISNFWPIPISHKILNFLYLLRNSWSMTNAIEREILLSLKLFSMHFAGSASIKVTSNDFYIRWEANERRSESAYKTLIITGLRLWPFTQGYLKLRQWCALYERADWLEGNRHHVIPLPMTPGNTNGSITMRPTTKPREYSLRLSLSIWPCISYRYNVIVLHSVI